MFTLENKKKAFSLILITILIFNSMIIFIPTTIAQNDLTINNDDGFWQINRFVESNLDDWEIDNTIDLDSGYIKLQELENVSLKTYTMQNNNVYWFPTISFSQVLPPFILQRQNPPKNLNEQYNIIENLLEYDEEPLPKGLTTEYNEVRQLVHYFQIKIDESKDSITSVSVNWHGRATDDLRIRMYVWYPLNDQFPSYFGHWGNVISRRSNSSYIWINTTMTNDIPIADEYIHICMVAIPQFSYESSLFSDYIEVKVQSEELATYEKDGFVLSEPIEKTDSNATWEWFKFDHQNEKGPKVKYYFYYENQTENYTLVEDKYIPSNSNGIDSSSLDIPFISLHDIPQNYSKLKIKAILYSSVEYGTPIIKMWGVTWQNSKSMWKDSFESFPPLRVNQDESYHILYKNDKIEIDPLANNWPMFGYNAQNIRKSETQGPDTLTLGWYYKHDSNPNFKPVGGKYQNPVLGNEYLYIPTSDGKQIYSFEILTEQQNPPVGIKETISLPHGYFINNTPAIYTQPNEKDIIVFATSNDYNSLVDGEYENKVYACYSDSGDNPIGDSPWSKPFSFDVIDEDDPNICYASSPVISEEDKMVFLSSWSGNNPLNPLSGKGNNYLIALDLDTGEYIWAKELSKGSYSSPAVSDSAVYVGIKNSDGPSVLAFNKRTGKELSWNASVGPISRASLLLYDNILIAISEKKFNQITVTALDTDKSGTEDEIILWQQNISVTNPLMNPVADNSPAIYQNKLYIATIDGYIHVLDIETGEYSTIWQTNPKQLQLGTAIFSSPACADGKVFISADKLASNGAVFVLGANTGSIEWTRTDITPVTSPIVSDGFIYYASSDGQLFCDGSHEGNQEIEGYFETVPIYLPHPTDTYIWEKLQINATDFANHITISILNENGNVLKDNIKTSINSLDFLNDLNTGKPEKIILKAELQSEDSSVDVSINKWSITFGINESSKPTFSNFKKELDLPVTCKIDVQDSYNGLNNTTAKFNLQYYETDEFKQKNGIIETDFNNGSKNKETLVVNLSSLDYLTINNSTMKIRTNISDLQILFTIENVNGTEGTSDWYNIISPKDKEKPILYIKSVVPALTKSNPPTIYVSSLQPSISIKAKDKGTEDNTTGLNVDSAQFELEYENESGDQTGTFNATCTGTNGTKNNVTIKADISLLDYADNITDLTRIRFSISDMAGNSNSSSWIYINFDDEKPYSFIENDDEIPESTNTTPVYIVIDAIDNLSGVKEVSLYYKKIGNSQWSLFDTDTSEPYTFNFTINTGNSGVYELISIAEDKAGNEENFSKSPKDITIDITKPSKPIFTGIVFNANNAEEAEPPVINNVTFEDDYKLSSVQYRMNFNGTNDWRSINDEPIDTKTYTPSWKITNAQWNAMQEDVSYYIYFKVTDSLGNTYITESNSDAMQIRKDFYKNSEYEVDVSDFENWQWTNEYIIRVNVNESEVINNIQLYYSYSENDKADYNWKQYGKNLSNPDYEWKFNPDEGDGYYSFYVNIWDAQGMKYTSEIKTVQISLFPTTQLMIFIILVIILFIISYLVFTQVRKSKHKV